MKVSQLVRSAPGKHGSAKIRVSAVDIFTGKKHEHIFQARICKHYQICSDCAQSEERVSVPKVYKDDYYVLSVNEVSYQKLECTC
jgi:translation elongation factor P/translation initiation factor 5A